jgi:hypothetical protein
MDPANMVGLRHRALDLDRDIDRIAVLDQLRNIEGHPRALGHRAFGDARDQLGEGGRRGRLGGGGHGGEGEAGDAGRHHLAARERRFRACAGWRDR